MWPGVFPLASSSPTNNIVPGLGWGITARHSAVDHSLPLPFCRRIGSSKPKGWWTGFGCWVAAFVVGLENFSGAAFPRSAAGVISWGCSWSARPRRSRWRCSNPGVLVGTCSQPETIRLLPPLTVDAEDWDVFFSAFEQVLGPAR